MCAIGEEAIQEKFQRCKQELDRLKKDKEKPRDGRAAALLASPLLGNLFVRNSQDVGFESIHFTQGDGCYVSWEHADYSIEKKDDRTTLPSRILFTEQEFNLEKRTFSGLINFHGSWGGVLYRHYELVFDTQFLCVMSGKTNLKKVSGETQTRDIFGKNCLYTNKHLEHIDDNNDEVVNRLENEGATEKSISQILANLLPSAKRELTKKYNAGCKTFGELTDGYYSTTRWISDEEGQYSLGEEKTEWVDMNHPRPCSYQKYNHDMKRNVAIPYAKHPNRWDMDIETIVLGQPSSSHATKRDTPAIPGDEQRGITLRQLRAVVANIIRRCKKEGWSDHKGKLLTLETVTLYDVDKYVIRPFTVSRQLSFVSCLPSTAGAQPPRFFISHWWGEAVMDFIECLEQAVRDFYRNIDDSDDARGGGMTADTPVWVCAYANNQWRLGDDITENPKDSGFTKALQVAHGRTMTILDKEAVVFTRIWCVFELFLTLIDAQQKEGEDGLWAVYTAHPHTYTHPWTKKEEPREAVGIISGGATCDYNTTDYIAGREAQFPFQLISQSMGIKVEEGEASVEDDRVHILNSIIGETDNLNAPPLTSHIKFDEVNAALKATFAYSVPNLQKARQNDDKTWTKFIGALSEGKKEIKSMTLNFDADGWKGISSVQATQLITNLPQNIETLFIKDTNFEVEFWDALIQRVGGTSNWKRLLLADTEEEDLEKAGVRLAHALSSNTTITSLTLFYTNLLVSSNVKEWGAALMENSTLTELGDLRRHTEIKEKLKEMTKDRTLKLKID